MATMQIVVHAKRPTGSIVAGETFALKQVPTLTVNDLKEGQILLKNLYLSLDPAMRGWLNDSRSYTPPVPIGGKMRGMAICVVTGSKSAKFPEGTYVQANIGWTEYEIEAEDAPFVQEIQIPTGARLTDSLGVLGLTGLTAYFGITDIAQVKPGDFVVVSGAAGATGSIAGQIAKLKGATVLGIAGSDEKVQWLKELGFDNALNYKDADFSDKFTAATEDFIDVFYDNVGGEVLDLAILRAKPFARFVICGSISQYNAEARVGPKNFAMVIGMRIKIQGFIVFDYVSRFPEARAAVSKWLQEGKIQRRETIIKGGLAAGEQALIGLYKGLNTGKLLLEVAPDAGKHV